MNKTVLTSIVVAGLLGGLYYVMLLDKGSVSETNIIRISLQERSMGEVTTIEVGKNKIFFSYKDSFFGFPNAEPVEFNDSKEITEEEYLELEEMIKSTLLPWDYDERYEEESLVDGSTRILTVGMVPADCSSCDADYHTVSCYGNCPDEINKVNNKIESMWGKK